MGVELTDVEAEAPPVESKKKELTTLPIELKDVSFDSSYCDDNRKIVRELDKLADFLNRFIGIMLVHGKGACGHPIMQHVIGAAASLNNASMMLKGPPQVVGVPGALPPPRAGRA